MAANVNDFPSTLGTPPRAGIAGLLRSAGALPLFVLALFAANLLLHFPGQFNNDSVNQYQQALSGQYADWHPPVMAWVWSLLLPFGEGTGPMLVLHLVLYWAGFGLLGDGLRRAGRPALGWAVAGAGAFPVFLYLNAVITKDVSMVAAWVAAVGLVFWFRVQARALPAWALALVAVLVAYGLLVRANAIFALGPLLVFMLARPTVRFWPLAIAAFVAAVLALPLQGLVNKHVFEAREQKPIHSLILFDLLGIAVHKNDPSILAPRATMTQEDLKACYTPYWFDPMSPWGRCGAKVNRPAGVDLVVQPEGLEKQWITAIVQNPGAYLVHRLKHFNSSLLFAVPPKHIRLTPEYRVADDGYKPLGTVTPQEVKMDIVRKNFVFWPVTWLAWAVVLLACLARLPANAVTGLSAALAVSGLAYSGAYLVIGQHTDMRFHYWSLAALLCATLVVLPELWAQWKQRARPLVIGLAALAVVVGIGTLTRLLDWRGLV